MRLAELDKDIFNQDSRRFSIIRKAGRKDSEKDIGAAIGRLAKEIQEKHLSGVKEFYFESYLISMMILTLMVRSVRVFFFKKNFQGCPLIPVCVYRSNDEHQKAVIQFQNFKAMVSSSTVRFFE